MDFASFHQSFRCSPDYHSIHHIAIIIPIPINQFKQIWNTICLKSKCRTNTIGTFSKKAVSLLATSCNTITIVNGTQVNIKQYEGNTLANDCLLHLNSMWLQLTQLSNETITRKNNRRNVKEICHCKVRLTPYAGILQDTRQSQIYSKITTSDFLLYLPSEQSETGRYTVFTIVCLSVCVCAHSVQSSTVCVSPTMHQPSSSCNPSTSPKLYKSCKKFTWQIYALCTLWAPSSFILFR